MICKFCGTETGKNGKHYFMYQCVRATKASLAAANAESAGLRRLLARLHTSASTMSDGSKYMDSDAFREASEALSGESPGSAVARRLDDMEKREAALASAAKEVAESLSAYCDYALPYDRMVARAASQAAYHIELLGGGRSRKLFELCQLEKKLRALSDLAHSVRQFKEKYPHWSSMPEAAAIFNALAEYDRVKTEHQQKDKKP